MVEILRMLMKTIFAGTEDVLDKALYLGVRTCDFRAADSLFEDAELSHLHGKA